MPHGKSGALGDAGDEELLKMMQSVHQTSEMMRQNLGACPVFSDVGGCPFKSARPGLSMALQPIESPATKQRMLFSKQLKEGTKASHMAAENVNFVKEFLAGHIEKDLYKQLIADLYHVYVVLERRLHEERNHPLVAPTHFPEELSRCRSLKLDMEYWFGNDWRSAPEMAPTPCTREYLDRLEAATPAQLMAHAYTRYMGDLSGGQVLMNRAKKALGLDGDDGLRFYVFERLDGRKAVNDFKKRYRAGFDGLPLDAEMAQNIISEANMAFLFNMRLFSELDVRSGKSKELVPLTRAVTVLKKQAAMSPRESEAECPFATLGKLFGLPNPHEDETKNTSTTNTTTPTTTTTTTTTTTVSDGDSSFLVLTQSHWMLLVCFSFLSCRSFPSCPSYHLLPA
jgi:heme oxygenase